MARGETNGKQGWANILFFACVANWWELTFILAGTCKALILILLWYLFVVKQTRLLLNGIEEGGGRG